MIGWEYRVIAETGPDGTEDFSIRDVYYNDLDEPEYYATEPDAPMGCSVDLLRLTMDLRLEALSKPVLRDADFKPTPGVEGW